MPTDLDRLRVMLVDDHTLFRSGLSELLERRGIEVCAAVGDGEEGCRLAAELEPDVVLLDLRMPELDGLSVLERLAALGLDCAVVMLTTSSDERDLVTSLRSGARGYLLKDMEPDQLVDALAAVVDGETVVAPEMTSVLARVVKGERARVGPAGALLVAHPARVRDSPPSRRRAEQQGDRSRPRHHRRHRQAARALDPEEARSALPGRGGGDRGRGAGLPALMLPRAGSPCGSAWTLGARGVPRAARRVAEPSSVIPAKAGIHDFRRSDFRPAPCAMA